MQRSLTALLSLVPLSVGCASQVSEDGELPDTLVDGAADSWSRPSFQGTLFEDTWQYGELVPAVNARNIAYTFSVDDAASIEVTTRSAPVAADDLTLTRSVVYLYKQSDAGTYRRIAKTVAGDDFGVLTRSLEEGTYRVLVKGVSADDEGEFMIKLSCTGAGCADGPQCLFDAGFHDLAETREGAITSSGYDKITSASTLFPNEGERIVAAVKVSNPNVATLAQAWDSVDLGEINRAFFNDRLAGRGFSAYEYGAGDNSFGAFFDERNQVVASIWDGDLGDCTAFASTCVFGRRAYDTRFMPDMQLTAEYRPTRASEVPAAVSSQLLAALGATSLDRAFELEPQPYVVTYRHTDGREFVAVHKSDATGAIFAAGSTTKVAELRYDGFTSCSAF
jgi:hypothetical protein